MRAVQATGGFRPRRSIRSRLIAAFFGLALGPLVLLALFLLPVSVYTRLDASLLRQDEAARRVAQDVATLFGEAETALRATLGEIQAYRLTGIPLELRLDALIAEGHRFSAAGLLDAQGVEVEHVEYDAIVPPGQRRDLYGLEPVARGLNTGAVAYGPVTFDPVTGEPFLLVVLPAPSPDRRGIEGALIGRLRLKPIWHVVARAWATQGLDAYIADSLGRVIAHRNPSVVLGGQHVELPMLNGLRRGLDGDFVARAAIVRSIGGEPLTVVVEVPLESAMEPVLRLLGGILLLLLGGVTVAAVFVRRARNSITRPLRALVDTVRAVSAGDLTRRAVPVHDDEIGDLARTFNEMTARLNTLIGALRQEVVTRAAAEDALRHLNEDLEARVVRRTAELSASESRLRAIMNTVLEGIVVADERGVIVAFNPAAERIFGLPAAEAIGGDLGMLMNAADAPTHRDALQRYTPGAPSQVIGQSREMVGRRRDGSAFPLEIAIAELMTGDGRLYIGALRDISARKAIERQLIAARDDAERANRAKSDFLSGMSHELRTPLNAILGFAQLLEMSPGLADTSKRSAYVEYILRAGRHLLSLIEDVLDLAKIEAGRSELAVEPVDLMEVVEEAMAIIGPAAESAGVEIVCEVGADAPRVMGDRRRVCQALVNLLSNAVKYNRAGGRATVGVDAGDPVRPRILVTDTGPGIPYDRLGELFEPFNRLDAGQSAVEGTGIGLAITRRMIDAMGGEVGVFSQEGVGSTFWIALPAAP